MQRVRPGGGKETASQIMHCMIWLAGFRGAVIAFGDGRKSKEGSKRQNISLNGCYCDASCLRKRALFIEPSSVDYGHI